MQVYDKGADELAGQCATKALLRHREPGDGRVGERVVGDFEQWEDQVTTAPGGDSTTRQRMKREGVLPSEFLSLPPASREGGLTGYFVVPEVGVFRQTVSPHAIRRHLHAKGAAPDYDPRPVGEQYLRPWDGDDFPRLGLTHHDVPGARDAPEPPPPGRGRLRMLKPSAPEIG